MTISSLAEVSARLEKAVIGLPGDAASPEQLYERYEQIAIAILDSEHSDWPEGVLEAFLLQRLAIKRIELSLED